MRPRKCTREILLLVKIMSNLQNKIEAILFWKGEPMSRKRLAEILSSSAKASDGQGRIGQLEINEAIEKLKENLKNRGIVLIEKDDEITLGTAPELSPLIEKLQKEELNRELSRASLETLSIILYKNGATRAESDYIRGVKSSFILRGLAVRGLVEKITDAKDSRRYIYRPSFDPLQFMGVQEIKD